MNFYKLVHKIIHDCSDDPDQLGAIRLNKILWFSDVMAYHLDGKPITKEIYVKRQFGPAPQRIVPVLNDLESNGSISIDQPEFEFQPTRYTSHKAPKHLSLGNREAHIISTVQDAVLGKSASQISEMSHDMIWELANEGEPIPLFATLAATRGEITQDTFDWAEEKMRKVFSEHHDT